jgi:hypothetical protein
MMGPSGQASLPSITDVQHPDYTHVPWLKELLLLCRKQPAPRGQFAQHITAPGLGIKEDSCIA